MEKRRYGLLAVLVLVLVLFMGVGVQNTTVEVLAATENISKAVPRNQFVKKNGRLYYYDGNGKIVKGWFTSKSGTKYYFGKDGVIRAGWIKINGEYYCFNNRGKMMTSCFLKNGKSTYYVNEQGIKVKGRYKVKNSWYSFNRNTGKLVRNGWYKETDGTYYYAQANGKLVSGFYKPDSYYRYFREEDCRMLTGWQDIDGARYYFKEKNGIRYDDCKITTSDGLMYYFADDGKLYVNQWFTKNGKTYYAKAEGALATGWFTLDGNTYYLNSKTGERRTGWVTLGSEKYYLSPSTGILYRNQWVDKDHYVGEDGTLVPGYTSPSFRWPLKTTYSFVTSYFGNRESPGGIGSTNHKGIDIYAPMGTPIYAAASGTVIAMMKPSESNGGGNYTKIDHGKGIVTEYMHQDKFYSRLRVGDKVLKGELIGYVGITGNVTGPHLHFGVLANGVNKDPLDFLEQPNRSIINRF